MQSPRCAAPTLHIVVAGRLIVAPQHRLVFGRGPDVDIDLDDPSISRLHAVLEPRPDGWTLVDQSRNGLFHLGQRITELDVVAPTTVVMGTGVPVQFLLDDGPSDESTMLVEVGSTPPVTAQGHLAAVHELHGRRVTIGRLPANDVVVDDLLVSRRHALLDRTADGGWAVHDLRSGNGTFVNGKRVGSAPLTEDDVIGVGHALLQLRGDRLVTFVDTGDNAFEADGISVRTAKGDTLLHPISFTVPGRTMLAVIGPSGAGKSTLLGALVGSRPADVGQVRYAGRSVYDDYAELRHRIALVPQDDVLHSQLTVRSALTYAAQLRFPADTSKEDRATRIDEVLAELGLTEHAEKRITQLSGGQRKRTSVALELLTRPSLLFLDEPTSGLDPGMDRSVMQTLRTLADDPENARTVVVVTHNVANLEQCDLLLLLAKGGHLAYFGPPAGALAHFGQKDYADIFLLLEQESGEHWAERFRETQPDPGPDAAPPPAERAATDEAADLPNQQHGHVQFAVLCRRYLAVIASDRQYTVFLAVLPLVLSLLARAVPGSAGLSVSAAAAAQDRQPGQLLLILVIGGALMGAAASIRELIKEKPIYMRERAIGLGLGAYLASKVVVLTAVVGIQAVLFTALSLWGRNGPDDPLVLTWGELEILVAVLAVTITSMLIGLAISAYIVNADRGMPLLVLMIMLQLIFSAGLFPVHDRPVLEQLAWLVPARWGFAMAAATADLSSTTPGTVDPLWKHTVADWATESTILFGIAMALILIIAARLARLDPRQRTRA